MPLILSSLPSCVPAGTLRATLPSGVGTLTVAPSAASTMVTGTWTSEIGAPPLEHGALVDLGDHVQISGGSTVRARLAFAFEADLGAVLHARRQGNGELLERPGEPGPAARGAWVLDDGAGAPATADRAD